MITRILWLSAFKEYDTAGSKYLPDSIKDYLICILQYLQRICQ